MRPGRTTPVRRTQQTGDLAEPDDNVRAFAHGREEVSVRVVGDVIRHLPYVCCVSSQPNERVRAGETLPSGKSSAP